MVIFRPLVTKMLLAALMLLSFYGFSFAEVLTLDRSVELALKNNYGVIAAQNTFLAKRGQVYTAWGSILPAISISATGTERWPTSVYFDQRTGRLVSNKRNYSGVLSFSANYSGLGMGTYAGIRQSYNDRGASYFSLQNAKSSLVLQVKENYYSVLKAKMLVDVAQDAVKRSEEGLRVAQSRYELGSASMSDVLKARVQVGNDKLDLLTNTNNYKLALANLAFSMGADVNQEYEVEEGLPERTITISYEAALNEAIDKNPEYRKSIYDLHYAEDQKLSAYSAFLPDFSLGVNHSTSAGRLSDLPDMKMANASRTYYASLNFNILNGFNDYARMRAARRNVTTFQENLKNTRNSVALQVRQAFLDLQRSDEAKALASEALAAAQEDANLVKEKYNLGAATILDVLNSEVSLKQAQTSKVQALFDFNLAISRLEKAMGR